MPFTPVQREKCEGCGKSVYATERTVLEGTGSSRVFHKTCIRCSTCNKALSVGDVISHDNVFYCKTHFNQQFKTKGNYDLQGKSPSSSHAVSDTPKSFIPATGDDSVPKQKHETSAATREKFRNIGGGEKCKTCGKSVYEAERLVVEEKNERSLYHKGCFRCQEEGCTVILDLRNYGSINGLVYCKPHLKEANERNRSSTTPSSSSSGPSKFSGRLGGGDYCKACEKRVYESEKLIVENRGERDCYHKACFKCQYEGGCAVKLDLRNYGSHADKVYCKNHLKEVSVTYVAKPNENPTPREVSEKFKNLGSGGDKCAVCGKGVYHLEKLTVEGTGTEKTTHFHKSCFKCSVCNQQLDLSTYGSNFGTIYCLTHLKTHGKAQQARQEVFISPLAANNPSSGSTQQRENEDQTRDDDEEERGALPPQSQEEPEVYRQPDPEPESQQSEPEPEPQQSEPEPEPQQSEPEPQPQETQDDDEDEEMRERRRRREERERKRREEEEEEERQLEQKRKEREERRRRLEE